MTLFRPSDRSDTRRRFFGAAVVLLALLPLASAQTFVDDFEDGIADGWTPSTSPAGWSIISSAGSLVYTQPAFDGGFPRSIYSGATWTKGYALSARVRMNGGGTGNLVGLIYHYTGPTSFHAVFLNRATNPATAQLWRANGGNPALIATGTFTPPPAADANWVTLTIERGHDNSTTVKVNDTVIPSLSSIQVLDGSGHVGVIDHFANGQWDDVTVTLLEEEEEPEPEPVETPDMTISGNGIPILDGDASPDTVDQTDFGSVPAPGLIDRTFTITNASPEYTLTLGDVILTGDFFVVSPPPPSLAPGQSGNFTLRFSPTLYFEQTGLVSIANNDPAKHPYTFAVRGIGQNVATGDIQVRGNADAEERIDSLIHHGDTTPTIVDHTDFGSEFVTDAWTTRTFTIHNLTSSVRQIASVTLSGSPDFTVTAEPASTVPAASGDRINADGRTSFSILFDPSSVGTKTATVTIVHDGDPSPYTFTIQGAGVEGKPFTKRAFPRIGGIFYRNNSSVYGSSYADPEYQQTIAKYDFGVINMYENWGGGYPVMNEVVNNIKALNPDILLTNYALLESTYDNSRAVALKLHSEVGPTGNGGTWEPNDWWAHHADGSTDTNPNYDNQFLTNHTRFVTPDGNGDRFSQFFGKWTAANLIAPVAGLDGVFTDNSFYKPRLNMDWDRNGVDDDQDATNVQAYYRTGIADFWAQFKASLPGHLIMGNLGGQPSYRRGYARDAQYQRKVEGALAETALGSGGSSEGYSGWYNLMTSYRSLLDNTLPPHLVLVGVRTTFDGRAGVNPNQYAGGAPYAFARYALATVLMDDGYIEFHHSGYGELRPPWFDELDLAGTATTSWLGVAVDPPQRAPRQNGVFVRRFEHGLAIVNPRTEPYLVNENLNLRSAQVVDLAALFPGQYYRRLVGIQDPVTNNGQLVTGPLVIQPGDGLLLRRYIDEEPPVITSAVPSESMLWPPNHRMVDLSLAVMVTDDADPAPITRIVSVSSNEAQGSNAPDWEITGDLTLKLRAERKGSGPGRIYTITVESVDVSGNRSTATTAVSVPLHHP